MRIITYDVEICDDPHRHPLGWEGARRGDCGVASVVLYDTDSERYHVYDAHTIDDCVDHLNRADKLVGFNCIDFDQPCIEGYTERVIEVESYDILHEVWDRLGEKKKGYGLGPICERTLNIGKSGNGVHAPQLFQEGRMGELIDYNLNDVFLTRKLANFIRKYGHIIDVEGNPLVMDKLEFSA